MAKTIGQVAYEKWFQWMEPMWSRHETLQIWHELHPGIRRKWEEIALAAVNQHIDDGLRDIERTLDAQMGDSDG
jgi:hypothetical protein